MTVSLRNYTSINEEICDNLLLLGSMLATERQFCLQRFTKAFNSPKGFILKVGKPMAALLFKLI